ncbi:uncharacterized protein N7459_005295 [Penicillium hispanicum]|uniref:uncharacterized protein n=1 Tax=Penicillium hispanicum TaxID=1080232 RepID=UPI00253FDCED|nr:uncharacterized protein N7459_005295 [Penicillium hispanicum]KAJ5585495.1 hypothetical protein N7459_005295 [Penicillium hispanicum]
MAFLAELLDSPHALQGVGVVLILCLISSFWEDLMDEIPYTRVPLVGKKWWELSNQKAKSHFAASARAMITEQFAKGVNVFQVMASTRPMIILHPKYIDEIKNHPYLTFTGAAEKDFFDDRVPGFDAFHHGKASQIVIDVVRIRLTQAQGSLIALLSKETAKTVIDAFPPSDEWKPYNFSHKVPYMVARISSLAFLGEKICRNQDWINVAVHYTIDAFLAARQLRQWPSVLRPLVHWFLQDAKRLRKHLAVARFIVDSEVEKRRLIREGKLPPDDPPRTHADCLDWFEELAQSHHMKVDMARGQIGLTLAATHTTSNLLINIMYDLAAYPEYIEPLRDEIRAVAVEDGALKKTSLLKMKLMDSVMKETQRLHPPGLVSMNRLAHREIPLSDGTIIPKGATVAVSAHIVHEDENIYPNATEFDGYRFYKKRQEPGHQHRHQLVTTTRESLGFGHGVHACPGRFFAANESKLLLIHMLLRYDWKLKEGKQRPKNLELGVESLTDPTVELLFRSREPEIDLRMLGA